MFAVVESFIAFEGLIGSAGKSGEPWIGIRLERVLCQDAQKSDTCIS